MENYIQNKYLHVASAHLTFVAIDREGNRLQVAPVVPQTDEEKRRYEEAGRRREQRQAELERRKRSMS